MVFATILVVEDSVLVNKHLELCLKKAGYDVKCALNSTVALELIQNYTFDLGLLDVMLNDKIDGIELGELISKKQDFPIIYLTALSDKETLVRAKNTRPFGFLIKPFKEPELLNNIEVALHKSKFEADVRKNRDFLATVLDLIGDSVIVTDDQLLIQYTNPMAERQIGLPFKNMVGESLDDMLEFRLAEHEEETIGFRKIYEEDLWRKHALFYVKSENNEVSLPIGNIAVRHFYNKNTDSNSIMLFFQNMSEQVERDRLERQLRINNLSLLIEGQEMERVRFSKDIHDGLGQVLNMIKLKVDMLPIPAQPKEETHQLVDEAVREVKRIANNLLPSLLNDFDLTTCVNYLANQYNDQIEELQINVESDTLPKIQMSQKINCFRIVQECVSNAVTHGKSKQVNIQIYAINDRLQISIEDDGSGFDLAAPPVKGTHHGLKIMKQRVESMNGEITIESNPKFGTFVNVNLPINVES